MHKTFEEVMESRDKKQSEASENDDKLKSGIDSLSKQNAAEKVKV